MAQIFLDRFERGVLFRLARFVATSAIFLILGSILAGSIASLHYFQISTATVTPQEVISSIKNSGPEKPENITDSSENNSKTNLNDSTDRPILLPFVLQKYIDTLENLKTLKSWMLDLNDLQKHEFLDELAQTVSAAEKASIDPLKAINRFKEVKLAKLQENKKNEGARNIYVIWFASLIATSLILISLLSLILVMLAVERNTRQLGKQ